MHLEPELRLPIVKRQNSTLCHSKKLSGLRMFRLIGQEGSILLANKQVYNWDWERMETWRMGKHPSQSDPNNIYLGNRPQVLTTRLYLPTLESVLPKQKLML